MGLENETFRISGIQAPVREFLLRPRYCFMLVIAPIASTRDGSVEELRLRVARLCMICWLFAREWEALSRPHGLRLRVCPQHLSRLMICVARDHLISWTFQDSWRLVCLIARDTLVTERKLTADLDTSYHEQRDSCQSRPQGHTASTKIHRAGAYDRHPSIGYHLRLKCHSRITLRRRTASLASLPLDEASSVFPL